MNIKPSRFGFVSELLRAYEYCQGAGVRKPFNKADEIRYYGLHLGLLQHDLGYPDTIGTGVLLPGEIMPAMLSEPGQ